jgi:hypothetical protein
VLLASREGPLTREYVYHVSATNALALGCSAALVFAVSMAATLRSVRRAARARRRSRS